MLLEIPGRDPIEIKHAVFDYNGTIAIDGKLIDGVDEIINELAGDITFHVITADTFGSVENQLAHVNCKIIKIPEENQDAAKLEFIIDLGKDGTLCVGNGRNDMLMLKQAAIGIALIQDEGACVETILSADIVCTSIMDVFAYFKNPNRLKATLRN